MRHWCQSCVPGEKSSSNKRIALVDSITEAHRAVTATLKYVRPDTFLNSNDASTDKTIELLTGASQTHPLSLRQGISIEPDNLDRPSHVKAGIEIQEGHAEGTVVRSRRPTVGTASVPVSYIQIHCKNGITITSFDCRNTSFLTFALSLGATEFCACVFMSLSSYHMRPCIYPQKGGLIFLSFLLGFGFFVSLLSSPRFFDLVFSSLCYLTEGHLWLPNNVGLSNRIRRRRMLGYSAYARQSVFKRLA